jgi:hypothetical protein
MVMFTIRNLGGISLLLAGSTWLWLTPAFATRGVPTGGVLWAVTRVMCLVTVAGFCLATWGLFTRQGWWEAAALGASVLGMMTLAPYALAAAQSGEAVGSATWNTFVHILMLVGVFTLLLVPSLEQWVDHQVMGGR